MASRKILIAEVCHSILEEELTKAGYQCDCLFDLSNEEVLNRIPDYYGLVVRSRIKVDRNLIDQATQLAFVARVGSGMELIDQAYAKEKGILCLNSPEGNKDSVAEHAIACMIALLKNIVRSDRALHKGQWVRKDSRGQELGSQVVGLIGYGNTGRATAEKLAGFGCKILAYDKYKEKFGSKLVVESKLEDLYEQATVLSIHLPLTPETNYWLNKDFFRRFKNDFYLINTSRGSIVQTTDLLWALETGKIKGAALDVFETEPLENLNKEEMSWLEALKKQEQVILTPHTAGLTSDSYFKLAFVLSKKIQNNSQLSS